MWCVRDSHGEVLSIPLPAVITHSPLIMQDACKLACSPCDEGERVICDNPLSPRQACLMKLTPSGEGSASLGEEASSQREDVRKKKLRSKSSGIIAGILPSVTQTPPPSDQDSLV